jgi:hypothetical protein
MHNHTPICCASFAAFSLSHSKMATADQQQMDPPPMSQESQETISREEKIFNENCDAMTQLLLHSLQQLASLAAQEGLIAYQEMDDILDKSKVYNKKERALLLVATLRKKIDKKAGNPSKVIADLLGSLEELKDLQEHLRKEYKQINETLPELKLIQRNGERIATMIDLNLQQVAGKLLQSGTITSEEANMVCNPAWQHNRTAITRVLDIIRRAIRLKPANLNKLIEILKEIGGPVTDIAQTMERNLQDIDSDGEDYPDVC